MSNIKESYNAIVESRKLVLTYISIVIATAIAFAYTRIIPDVNDFLEYIPDKSSVDPSVLVSVYNKHVDAMDSVMVNLFLFCGGIVAAYMSVNVWQKFSPGYSEGISRIQLRKGQGKKEDESDPEQIPDEV